MEFQNPLWQSHEWEKFQNALGNPTYRIQDILLIERKTVLGKKFLEIPRVHIAFLSESFWNELELKAQKRGAIVTRIFPADLASANLSIPIPRESKSIPEIFPENTLILNLQNSEEQLLAEMKPKGRYNISLAQKKGVEVFPSDDISEFHRLIQETTSRDGFSGHTAEVYRKMLESFGSNGMLLLAEYENKIIAGGIFLFCDGTATYYYGASANEYRNVMAPYLVQWEAIKDAKKRGCEWYDFLGIAPENVEKHALSGVSQFKEKFGGIRIQYAPAFEVVHHRAWHKLLGTLKKMKSLLK